MQVSKFWYKKNVLNGNEKQYFGLHFSPPTPTNNFDRSRLHLNRGFRNVFPHPSRRGSGEMPDGRCSTSCPGWCWINFLCFPAPSKISSLITRQISTVWTSTTPTLPDTQMWTLFPAPSRIFCPAFVQATSPHTSACSLAVTCSGHKDCWVACPSGCSPS